MKIINYIIIAVTLSSLGLCSVLAVAQEQPAPPDAPVRVPAPAPIGELPMPENDVLMWVGQNLPQSLPDLERLKQESPQEFEQQIRGLTNLIRHIEGVKQRDPEMFARLLKAENLERESWKVAQEIAQTQDAGAKKQLTAKLQNMLAEIFESRLASRMMEIQTLEQELQNMKAMIEKRKANKAEIIKRHLDEMLSVRDESLNWW
jgi:hypothetical protein